MTEQPLQNALVLELRQKCDWCNPCRQCLILMQRAAEEIEGLRKELKHQIELWELAGQILNRVDDANFHARFMDMHDPVGTAFAAERGKHE